MTRQYRPFLRGIPLVQAMLVLCLVLCTAADQGCRIVVTQGPPPPPPPGPGSTGPLSPTTTTTPTSTGPLSPTTSTTSTTTVAPPNLKFIKWSVAEVSGEATDATSSSAVLEVELYKGRASDLFDSNGTPKTGAAALDKQSANQTISGGSAQGHGFKFAVTGKGLVAGDLVSVKAVSSDKKSFRVVTSDPLTAQ